MTNCANQNNYGYPARFLSKITVLLFVSFMFLTFCNCALLFPSLFNQNIQENSYCSDAKEKSIKCNQLEGQEKNYCIEEANKLQQKCIEAIQNESRPIDEINKKGPQIDPEEEKKW